ncbi:MAG: hypothetical protein VKJ06_08470 [Vampirovibrionales bacterium]|nr:hypothetical protein [Vampirovibrionales bacterium]
MPTTLTPDVVNAPTSQAEQAPGPQLQNAQHAPLAFESQIRRYENLHIVFWLLKDLSWCMLWKPLGVAMIIPTLALALHITWKTRHHESEWIHNLAVICWITANAYWMVVEFLGYDETLRWFAFIPFISGITLICGYYGVLWFRKRQATRANQLQAPASQTLASVSQV